MEQKKIDRRTFIKRVGLLSLLPALLPLKKVMAFASTQEPKTKTYYYLESENKKCNACMSHAKNKRFRTASAITRAHPNCRCKIKVGKTTLEKYKKWFSKSESFDLRYKKA